MIKGIKSLIELLSSQGEARRARFTPRNAGRSTCFTLIELLVVIAIIAILASLLLPTLSRARRTAKNVVCMNNMHEMAIGLVMYADEYSGFYPVGLRSDPAADRGGFTGITHPNPDYDLYPVLRDSIDPGTLSLFYGCPFMEPKYPSPWSRLSGRRRVPIALYVDTFSTNGSGQYLQDRRGMTKVGRPFVVNWPGTPADGLEYSILVSDMVFYASWKNGFIVTQKPFAGRTYGDGNTNNHTNGQFGWMTNHYNIVDANFALEDGSVRHYPRINANSFQMLEWNKINKHHSAPADLAQ